MPKLRSSQGGAYCVRGAYFARVTVAPQKRKAVKLPWCTSMEDARERAGVLQTLVQLLREAGKETVINMDRFLKNGAEGDAAKLEELTAMVNDLVRGAWQKKAPPTPARTVQGPTFGELAGQWTRGELHRLFPDHVGAKKTADDDDLRLAKWVLPHLQHKPLASLTLEDFQCVLRALPATLAPGSRRHVAQLMTKVMNMAVYPCRHITASPIPRGFLPRAGAGKALAWVYPDEDRLLLAATTVPLVHRVLYAFAHREGMRSDEAQRLTWGDLDLRRGVVRLDENKTEDARTWALGRDVVAALSAWQALVAHGPKDPVFPNLVKPYVLAQKYREHLQAAGVKRAELFERTKARRPIRFHDARASFITLALATGRTEGWVAARTGHTSSMMINRYRRPARMAEEIGLSWFAEMHLAIPELAAAFTAATRLQPQVEEAEELPNSASHHQFRRMDSNHDKRIQNPLSCH